MTHAFRTPLVWGVSLLLVTSAAAHDFWLQPDAFQVEPDERVTLSVLIGHLQERERWPVPDGRVTEFADHGPAGKIDLRHRLRRGINRDDPTLRFVEPGTHMVALETNHSFSELPADQFNRYLDLEGMEWVREFREKTGAADRPGREVYSRRAKTLIRVGPLDGTAGGHVTRPIGQTLEIVPRADPHSLKSGEPLTVQVLYQGEPLEGGLVKLLDLAKRDGELAATRTDSEGNAAFDLPGPAVYLMTIVWTRPLVGGDPADFDTTFSSLSFEIAEAAASEAVKR